VRSVASRATNSIEVMAMTLCAAPRRALLDS
jgi:hypothetical protein